MPRKTIAEIEGMLANAADSIVYWQCQAFDLQKALENLLASELWHDRPEVMAAKELIRKVKGEL